MINPYFNFLYITIGVKLQGCESGTNFHLKKRVIKSFRFLCFSKWCIMSSVLETFVWTRRFSKILQNVSADCRRWVLSEFAQCACSVDVRFDWFTDSHVLSAPTNQGRNVVYSASQLQNRHCDVLGLRVFPALFAWYASLLLALWFV